MVSNPISPQEEVHPALVELRSALQRYLATVETSGASGDLQLDRVSKDVRNLAKSLGIQSKTELPYASNVEVDDASEVPDDQVSPKQEPQQEPSPPPEDQLSKYLQLPRPSQSIADTPYIENLEQFGKEVLQAGQRNLLHKPRYQKVVVLILTWKNNDSPDIAQETTRVKELFSQKFGFIVKDDFGIPNDNSDRRLNLYIANMVQDFDEDTLLIVYYNGHGTAKGNECYWHPTMAATQISDKTFEPVGPTLRWNPIQGVLLSDKFDVLIVLDCCYAGAGFPRSKGPGPIKEILAACEKDRKTPDGERSFTKRFIQATDALLTSNPRKGFQVNTLFDGIKRLTPSDVPDPVRIDLNDTVGSIRLAPLPSQSFLALPPGVDSKSREPSLATSSVGSEVDTRPDGSLGDRTPNTSNLPLNNKYVVLVSRLKENLTHLSIDAWKESVRSLPKTDVDELAIVKVLDDIEISAAFSTNSTLCIISMPVYLWTLLPNKEAYTTIGFSKSHNILLPSPPPPPPQAKQGIENEAVPFWITAMDKLYKEVKSHSGKPNKQGPGLILSNCQKAASVLHIPPRYKYDPAYRLMQEIVQKTAIFRNEDDEYSGESSFELRLKLEVKKLLAPIVQQVHNIGEINNIEQQIVRAAKIEAEKEVVDKCVKDSENLVSGKGKGSEKKSGLFSVSSKTRSSTGLSNTSSSTKHHRSNSGIGVS